MMETKGLTKMYDNVHGIKGDRSNYSERCIHGTAGQERGGKNDT